MAVTYNFDTKYYEQKVEGATDETGYRIVIGNKSGDVDAASTQLELMSPGMSLRWQGGDDLAKNSTMGGSLSFTAVLTDAQLATWESYMNHVEGDVFALFFNTDSATAEPYWYGHLLPESVTIRVENDRHLMDVEFTDGLSQLKFIEWVDDNDGLPYEGFKTLRYYLHELLAKLPAYHAYKDYVTNVLGNDRLEIVRAIAWPEPNHDDNGTQRLYNDRDTKLDNFRVRAATFNKPKKQQNRVRELESALEYFSAGDVLEDICKAFGATACLYGSCLTVACRLDVAWYGGSSVLQHQYWYQPSTASYPGTSGAGANSNPFRSFGDLAIGTAENKYHVAAGATKTHTVPVRRVDITHEEGGSDNLYADGFFLNPSISFINYDSAQSLQSLVNSGMNPLGALRKDKFFDFQAPDNNSTGVVNLPVYQYPANASGYLGFPSRTETDLEYQSGENLRLTFGGSARFFARNALNLLPSNYFKKVHIGATLIIRVRLQLTTTTGTGYRLSRPVKTHALSGGSPDFITIDNVQQYFDSSTNDFFNQDKEYFRKLYGDMVWLKDNASNYEDDGWFEIIVPHGDNENSGEGYGSTITPLTQPYGGQVIYAPIGTKIKGDDNGVGVVLEESTDDETLLQYFREDINLSLPYGNAAGSDVLDFETFFFEMGAQEYEPSTGPREASGGGATGTWEGDLPLWKSAKADGTAYAGRYDGDAGEHLTRPDYIHFTGMRVTVGDGSESSDLTTKATGTNGYEIVNLGSSRIGSRKRYGTQHVSGVVGVKKKTGDAEGAFADPVVYIDTIQWRGHRAGDFGSPGFLGSSILTTDYDSIHRYVAESYLNIFGKSRMVYNLKLISKDSSMRSLQTPLSVVQTTALSDGGSTRLYLQPLSYRWTLNDGVQGSFLVSRQARDLSTVTSDEGRPIRGGGGIVGIGTGVDGVAPALESKFVTDTITVDVDTGDVTGIAVKSGATLFTASTISDFSTAVAAVSEVATNTLKTSFPGFGTGAGTALEGTTDTLGDISGLGSVLRTDGSGTAVEGIKEHANQLTLVADSTIPGQTGSKRFTIQDFFTAIVTSGLEEADSGGFVDIADYVGATSGVVGDFNDDGQVGSADLLQFLILYGQIFEGDNGAFANSYLQIQSNSQTVNFPDTTARTLTWSNSNVPANLVVQSGVSINILDASDEIEFVSGATTQYPITAWTHKRVILRSGGTQSNQLDFLTVTVTFPSTAINIGVSIKALKADGTEAQPEAVELMGVVFVGPANTGRIIGFSSLVGLNKWTSSTDLSDPLIEKVRVSIFAQPVDNSDVLCNVSLKNVRIGLESVSS